MQLAASFDIVSHESTIMLHLVLHHPFFQCFHLFTNFPEASALLNGFCSKKQPLTIVMWVACF